MWCWHHIRENLNGLCPACRTPYNADPHAFSAVDRQDIIKKNRDLRAKEKEIKKKELLTPGASISRSLSAGPTVLNVSISGQTATPSIPRSTSSGPQQVDRRQLHNYRVVQRNLVYVIGLPPSCASEEKLRSAEYFGQYGKIGKIVVHRSHSGPTASCSAYITFAYKEDAKASIHVLEAHWFDGHILRASFGTSKYCNNFIRGLPCNNPDCVYLHELGNDEDRFTKAEIQAGQSKLVQVPGVNQVLMTGNGGPSGTGKRPVGEPVLPAPIFIQDIVPQSKAAGQAVQSSSNAAAAVTVAGTAGVPRASSTWGSAGSLSTAGSVSPNSSSSDLKNAATAAVDVQATGATKQLMRVSTEAGAVAPRSSETSTGAPVQTERKPYDQMTRQEKTTEAFRLRAEAELLASAPSSAAAAKSSPLNTDSHADSAAAAGAASGVDAASGAWPHCRPDLHAQLQTACFNGVGRCAVFTVPVSSLSEDSIWSIILQTPTTAGSLDINPYVQFSAPFSELLDLTLPPVDAVSMPGWPKPNRHYLHSSNGAGSDSSKSGTGGVHVTSAGHAALSAILPGVNIRMSGR